MNRARLTCACSVACLAASASCQSFPDPPVSYVAGLRVLGIKAEPPEVAQGASSNLTMLVVDTAGGAIAASWTECLLPPIPGDAVNKDCAEQDAGSFLQPIGDGLAITATMPQVTAASLGQPDVTNGVYLPLVARVVGTADALTAIYRLRLLQTATANANPTIASIVGRDASGVSAPLDATNPPTVSSGGTFTLSATFTPDSAETYTAIDGTTKTETLTTSWFATAGTFSYEKTSATQPETVLHLDKRLPASGSTIDVWAVMRDERGGTDYTHRTLSFR
jgi:hypothetical protein